jgi:hypothetical protein
MRALVHTEDTTFSVRVGVGAGRVVGVSRPFCRDTVLDWCRNRTRFDVASDGEAEEAHEGGEDANCVHLGGVNWLEWSGDLRKEEEKGDRKHRRDTCLIFKVVVRGLMHRSPLYLSYHQGHQLSVKILSSIDYPQRFVVPKAL